KRGFWRVGFSGGSRLVRSIAEEVQEEGINIDLMVYLSSNILLPLPLDPPANVARTVNIMTGSPPEGEPPPARMENVYLSDVWHFGAPAHPQTLKRLPVELARVTTQAR